MVHRRKQAEKDTAMQDQDEVIVGYLIQREDAEGELSFWEPRNEWQEDPNEGKLYEKVEEAEADAKALQEGDDATITVELVFEADDEDWDEDEEEDAHKA